MNLIIFIVLLVCILVYINFSFMMRENFDLCEHHDRCSKYNGETYSKCYNNECSVMIDLIGNAFCTAK
jgi:hypothetical protein